ncbi:MAG: CDP-diacylglycerol--glycerol-3-phosphate 3-phosphatidyltransferase [Chloroflexi bacterium]|nr:CDP-diacylglycerol--glycerol-3-phosphate 3-phosphatidyltransferase [Chloroflexota bacterium]MQC26763.1 CDP-diacylglycerol--glycerol-3-phosphate 3-phosphatidyltransferase [Chloroflexota bacterium]
MKAKWSLPRGAFPWELVGLRLALGPILLFDALDGVTDLWFVAGLGLAILTDIYDGILARRLGVASVQLRRADSLVDRALFFFVAGAAWAAHRGVLMAERGLVATMLILSVVSQVPALVKFGKAAAYHAYSAKAAGLALLAAGVLLFGWGRGGLVLQAAM